MLFNSPVLFTYCKYLSIYDALNLEQTCSKFKTIHKYRYLTSRALVQYICNTSQIKFTLSIYNNIYDILYKLHLLDYTIFIVGSASKLMNIVNKLHCCNKYEIENIFAHTLPPHIKICSTHNIFTDLRKYTSKLNKILANPKIIIINYLANNNPDYFTQKYGICCSKSIIDLSRVTEYSNIIVCLYRILPAQIWNNNPLYETIISFNTDKIKRNKLLNYPKNTFLTYILTNMFTTFNKRIVHNKLKFAFYKLSNVCSS